MTVYTSGGGVVSAAIDGVTDQLPRRGATTANVKVPFHTEWIWTPTPGSHLIDVQASGGSGSTITFGSDAFGGSDNRLEVHFEELIRQNANNGTV